MRTFIMGIFIFVMTSHALPSRAQTQNQADPLCLASHCGKTMMQCGLERECRSWLQCVLKCGDDKVKCPSVCGFFYQSPKINQTSSCIFDSQCVDLGFKAFPNYDNQNRPALSLEGIEGTYWFVASFGGKHIFDYDCQRFDFKKRSDDSLAVTYSVPLTLQGATRTTGAQGVFRPLPEGSVEVIYNNFGGYHEKWFIVDKSENTILAHVCIGAESICYDYGTILLAKKDLALWDAESLAKLDQKTKEMFDFGVRSFHRANIRGCRN